MRREVTVKSTGTTWVLMLGAAMIVAAGCQGGSGDEEGMYGEGAMTHEAEMGDDAEPGMMGGGHQGGRVRIELHTHEPYGEFLVTGSGMPLYMFTADQQGGPSSCYDRCAEAWPPLITGTDPAELGRMADKDLLGTIERDDGRQQVTYGGWPLYTYREDSPTDVQGQGVNGFGGDWYLVGPDGTRIEATGGS